MRISRRRIKIKKYLYLIREGFPNDDYYDDEDTILDATYDLKEALILAAKYQKKEMIQQPFLYEVDDDEDSNTHENASEIYIQKLCINEQTTDDIDLSDEDILYRCTFTIEFLYDKDKMCFSYGIYENGDYFYLDNRVPNHDFASVPPRAEDKKRIVSYAYSANRTMYNEVYSKDVDYFDEYKEQLIEMIEEACKALNDGEDPEEIREYLYGILDNTGRDYNAIKTGSWRLKQY